jgi:hypothetical protein
MRKGPKKSKRRDYHLGGADHSTLDGAVTFNNVLCWVGVCVRERERERERDCEREIARERARESERERERERERESAREREGQIDV